MHIESYISLISCLLAVCISLPLSSLCMFYTTELHPLFSQNKKRRLVILKLLLNYLVPMQTKYRFKSLFKAVLLQSFNACGEGNCLFA